MKRIGSTLAVLSIVFGWAIRASDQLAFAPSSPALDTSLPSPSIQFTGVSEGPLTRSSRCIPADDLEATFAQTIVSTLSSSNQHTIFIRLLQRSKCIPLLAHIGNSTVFAPTDNAWKEWFSTHTPDSGQYMGWLDSSLVADVYSDRPDHADAFAGMEDGDGAGDELDNQNWALRQHLLYHMLNYTLPPSAFVARADAANITTQTSLLFPLAEEPVHPPTPPPGPPWLPRGGDGLLGGHGQRLRIAKSGSESGGDRGKVGIDFDGSGGVSVWNGSGWPDLPSNASAHDLQAAKGRKKV